MEQEKPHGAIAEHFGELYDPRWYNRRHKLLDILVIAICAAICGAEGWEDVELFGKTKAEWLRRFLELPHGIPYSASEPNGRRLLGMTAICSRSWPDK
jgi:hypothetical protein